MEKGAPTSASMLPAAAGQEPAALSAGVCPSGQAGHRPWPLRSCQGRGWQAAMAAQGAGALHQLLLPLHQLQLSRALFINVLYFVL